MTSLRCFDQAIRSELLALLDRSPAPVRRSELTLALSNRLQARAHDLDRALAPLVAAEAVEVLHRRPLRQRGRTGVYYRRAEAAPA